MIETAFVEHTREMPGVSIPAKKDLGLQRLLTSLDYICGRLQGRPDDMQFLNEVLHSPDFQSLLKVHYKIEEQHNKEPPLPVINSAAMLALEVSQDITEYPLGQDAEELGLILQSPLMQMILHVHDRIATKEFYPKLQEVEADMSDGDDSMKIVRLVKSNEPLGATITCDERTGSVKIARIMHSGAADRSGLIHVNDEVVEVDGIRVKGKTPDEVVSLLSSINGTITFKLIPANAISNGALESQVRVKAFFNFDPDVDRSIPCVEAGLPFKKGDILHIVAQDDPQWWQARIEGDPEMRTGLIPGKVLQERREALSRSLLPTQSPTPSLKSVPGGRASSVNSVPSSPDLNFRRAQNQDPSLFYSLRLSTRSTTSLRSNLSSRSSLRIPNKKKTKKIMYQSIQNHNYDVDEILIYEEVTLFRAPPERPRPLVIVGPPGVGKNELKKRLMASKPFHFKSTIPHTSRPKKLLETNGKEYIFISKEEFERNIRLNKFVEWGEYKGNMYGTSLDSVRGAILAAKVAILIVCPPALKLLKASDVKPYVIFIKPPSFQRLKSSRMASKAVYTMEKKQTKSFTDEEFMDMIESGIRMEANYGHYFDCTIVNEDLTTAYNELIATAMRIEREPQWVPSSWMR
ncbi:MAGUK p55 subfamily member 7-like isoform X2 [Anneissia japonica]|uniref:MAGUK p55 subfamily member 7-like isoform X2 n=1 Tax=Anneissia japonica TaxID=1529436 RepID=UPI0014258A71|nr:MAGUK p55 subfamily member 7-like isoform X2 [Anneissia japonica]